MPRKPKQIGRKMKRKDSNIIINVVEHIILKNYWEYYITDDSYSNDIKRALVMGFETELGDVSLNEIKPYIISRTTKLNEIAPAQGWEWV